MALFRTEAIENQKLKLEGDVLLVQPPSFRVVSGVLFFLVFFVCMVLAFGSYARTEMVAGHIVASKGLAKIYTPRFSHLERLYVHEGEKVKKGQILAALKLDDENQSGHSMENNLLGIISHQIRALEEKISAQESLYETTMRGLYAKSNALKKEKQAVHAQVILNQEILQSTKTLLERTRGLAEKGLLPMKNVDQAQQDFLGKQAHLALKRQELSQLESQQEQVSYRIEAAPDEQKKLLADLMQKIQELQKDAEAIKGQQSIVVHAPVDGTVTALVAKNSGKDLLEKTVLMTVLPDDSVLEVELYVPSRAMGFVEAGQEVRVMYDAFPYQRFGSYPAIISTITTTILNPNEITTPFAVHEPGYRVTAMLEKESVSIAGKNVRLQPGMLLRANIILDRRSLLDWLLEPFYAVGNRS